MRIAIVLAMCAAAVIAAQPVALPRAAPESVELDPNRLEEPLASECASVLAAVVRAMLIAA